VDDGLQERGNIGEWSELYALAYLLVRGGANAADENQKPITDLYFKVLEVIINSHNLQSELRYEINDETILIHEDEQLIERVTKSSVKFLMEKLFCDLMSDSNRKTFSVDSGAKLMGLLHKKTISAGSSERESDIQLIIADAQTGGPTPRFGFSIKSQLGQASTLLNSSGSTNLIYEIVPNSTLTQKALPDISDSPSSHPKNIRRIYEAGYVLKFHAYQSEVFYENLTYIDSQMPQNLAEVLLQSYLRDDLKDFSRVSELAFPPALKSSQQPLFKLQEFLGAVSMGLRPNAPWKGNSSKFKGLIVIKIDGEIVFYYLNSRLNFERYLYQGVRFERPSTSRHKYGYIFSESGRNFIKLNLQIRFKK
jgi:type II restriction enzyme